MYDYFTLNLHQPTYIPLIIEKRRFIIVRELLYLVQVY